MKYKTKEWSFDAFQYGIDEPPKWWIDLVDRGKAFEYKETLKMPAYAGFSDKRSDHKAFVGDWIVLDEHGRRDVYSEKKFASRAKLK